ISARLLRDQINEQARTILWLLLGAAGVLFVISCSNVANLMLARTVRRESELAIRAALGASSGALRRSLLAESLVLCGRGGRRWCVDCCADVLRAYALCVAILRESSGSLSRFQRTLDGLGLVAGSSRFPRIRSPAALRR